MNSYIYEMDVAMLRVGYIIPEGLICFQVRTTLFNWTPYDRSKLQMVYEIQITGTKDSSENNYFKSFEGHSLQQVTEDIRKYYILNPYKQSLVEKSPEDGTESVITTP